MMTRRELLSASAGTVLVKQAAPEAESIRVFRVIGEGIPHDTRGLYHFDEFLDDRDFKSKYFEVDTAKGSLAVIGGLSLSEPSGCLRCTFEKGQVSAGSLKVAFGDNPVRPSAKPKRVEEVYWRVYVLHEPGWQGNPAKMSRAMCMAGNNWTQGMIAHVWGGKADALCIDPATGILDSRLNTRKYNDFERLKWLGLKPGRTPVFSATESGRWVCVEAQAKLNTPGKSDGQFRLWVDAQLEAEHTALNWHGEWQERGINAVFLENYWNEGSPKKQSRYFDDFVVSPHPIGPVRTGPNPVLEVETLRGSAWQARVFALNDQEKAVWEGFAQPVGTRSIRVSEVNGKFETSGITDLKPGSYAIRMRLRNRDGMWYSWGPLHAPFQVDVRK